MQTDPPPASLPSKRDHFEDSGNGAGDGVPDPGTQIVPLPHHAGPNHSISPVTAYLLGLSPASRRTQLSALESVASVLSNGQVGAYEVPWAQMDWSTMQALRAALGDGRFAPTTANRYISAVRGVLKACWRLGLLTAEELARATDVPAIRGSRLKHARVLQDDEVARLLRACRSDQRTIGRRDEAMLALLYGTGLRRAELAALRLSDVADDLRSFTTIGKGNKERRAYLNDDVRSVLSKWLDARGLFDGPLFTAVNRSGACRATGHLTPQTVADVLARRAAEAGISGVSPHGLRATAITKLLDEGVDLATTSDIAGHADPKTTKLYASDRPNAARAATSLLRLPA